MSERSGSSAGAEIVHVAAVIVILLILALNARACINTEACIRSGHAPKVCNDTFKVVP